MKLFTVLSAIIASFALSACSQQTPEQLTEMLEKHPEILVKAIEKNPDVVFGAIQKAAQNSQAKSQQNQQRDEEAKLEAQFSNPLKPVVDEKRAVLGDSDAQITIVEYTDFQCPYCARGYATLESIRKQYGNKVKVLVKNLPLDFHPMAMPASKRFEALKLQSPEKGYAFYHEIFKNQEVLKGGEKALDELAKKVGADMSRLKKDVDSDKVRNIIAEDMAEAGSFGIQGTPGFVINGVALKGAYPEAFFKKVIDRHLSSK